MEDDETKGKLKATRKDIHITRRLFHMGGGLSIGLIYQMLLTHQQAIYILGMAASSLYVLEQVRISYPDFAAKVAPFSKYLFRAEEQLKESAGIPFLMGVLLTLLTFPKMIALIAIYTLAFGDPLSAIIGIKFGKREIVGHKTLEGAAAFFISCLTVSIIVSSGFYDQMNLKHYILCFVGALGMSLFELIPLKIDDNLTIPLATAIWFWFLSWVIL